jgi:hypothetical protein
VVRVIRDELTVTPATASVAPGEVVSLRVGGGTAPYAWATEAGSLDTLEGSAVRLVAPQEPGRYSVSVSDGREAAGRAVIRVGAVLPQPEGCESECGGVDSRMRLDGVEQIGRQLVADEGADLGLEFNLRPPAAGGRHHLYAAVMWTPPEGAPMLLFRTNNPDNPFVTWEGGEFPAWGEVGGGEETLVDFYSGPSGGLAGSFEFYLGFAPVDDPAAVTYTSDPYRLEVE